jgi:hypothetical membrane protein
VPVRLAALCGLLAPVTYTAALLFGGLAQRDVFSSADDATSDLGADTASSPWIYNPDRDQPHRHLDPAVRARPVAGPLA